MTSKLMTAGALMAGCVTAAGVGGYLSGQGESRPSPAAAITARSEPQMASEGLTGGFDVPPVPRAVVDPAESRPRNPVATSLPRRSSAVAPAPVAPPPNVETLPAAAALPASPVALESSPAPAIDSVARAATEPPPSDMTEPVVTRATRLSLPANAVIGIRLETTATSATAEVEDEIKGRVTRPVEAGGIVVIPEGARLIGSVTEVQRGGRVRERARIGIRFTSVEIEGERIPIRTEPIFRDGDAPTGEATAKIGASAVVGSILGGVIGGRRGAVIGGAAGAAGGTAMVMAGEPNPAELASGSSLTVRLEEAAEFVVPR
jgi:hypothetical protein